MSKKNNILITGGLGFIGSNLAKIILKKNCIKMHSFRSYTGLLIHLKIISMITENLDLIKIKELLLKEEMLVISN